MRVVQVLRETQHAPEKIAADLHRRLSHAPREMRGTLDHEHPQFREFAQQQSRRRGARERSADNDNIVVHARRICAPARRAPTEIIRLHPRSVPLEVPRLNPMRLLFSISFFALVLPIRAAAPLDVTPVRKWIARQDEFRNVQADFTQTRSLRALRSPIAVPGRMCFSTPNSLRWELGDPAKTIVLRKGETYFLIQPAKKKAERLTSGNVAQEGGARGFAMMEFPLARDFGEFNRKFEILAVNTEGNRCHLEILPRDAQARKFLSALKIDFDTATGYMLSFEMATRDGSSMRNEFSNVRVNQKIDRRVFEYDLTGYEVVDEKN